MEATHEQASLNRLAASATTHCLTGCPIGEVTGMVVGTAVGFGEFQTMSSRSSWRSSSATR